ncbi:MAG: MATE family efflux transporter [Clostridia bacterium]|nr:MATE family efflux transporter [Clostridia bacterium]
MLKTRFAGQSRDICSGPMLGNIVFFAIPIVLSGFLQLLYNAVDLVVVGRYCGELYVAAVGATAVLINLIVNVFIGFSVGVNVTVANLLGAGKHKEASRAVHTAVAFALICGIAVGVIGFLSSSPLLKVMSTPDNVIDLASLYVKIYFLGSPANIMYNFLAAVLRAKGDTKRPLYILTVSGLINVVLNVWFVASFKMGVAGVAISTVISQYVSAILVLLVLMRSYDCCIVHIKEIRIDGKALKSIVRIGLPSGIASSFFNISNSIIQTATNSFNSSAVIAGSTAAANIEGFVNIGMDAVAQAVITFVGQNKGAGKYDRVGKTVKICALISIISGVVIGTLVTVFARPLLSIYLPGEEEAILCGIVRVRYMCSTFFILGLMNIYSGALRGFGSSIAPTVVQVAGVCGIRFVWIFTVFKKYHTLDALFATYPITWVFTAAALIFVFYKIKNEEERIVGFRK